MCRRGGRRRQHQPAGCPAPHPAARRAGSGCRRRQRAGPALVAGWAHPLPPQGWRPVALRRRPTAAAAAATRGGAGAGPRRARAQQQRQPWHGRWAPPAFRPANVHCSCLAAGVVPAPLQLPVLLETSAIPATCYLPTTAGDASVNTGTALPQNLPAGSAAGGKATTDTARRILATLDALDKVVAASPPGGAAAALAGREAAAAAAAAAASPPPTDSLGFAGLHRVLHSVVNGAEERKGCVAAHCTWPVECTPAGMRPTSSCLLCLPPARPATWGACTRARRGEAQERQVWGGVVCAHPHASILAAHPARRGSHRPAAAGHRRSRARACR